MLGRLAESLYGLAATAYHRRWDRRGGTRVAVPVISVGNLTVGGNGKTPFVIELVRVLREHFPDLRERHRIAVLSRGYGRHSGELCVVEAESHWTESGDEPLLIKRSCPDTLVIAHARRLESARMAIDRFDSKLIILDDGFQHRVLARDLDLVLLDAHKPLGNGRLLPVGPLREPVTALERATHLVSVGTGGEVASLAKRFDRPMFAVEPRPLSDIWPDRPVGPVFLLTGVARPERVRSFLEFAGFTVVGHRAFRDHHAFTEAELHSVAETATRSRAATVLTTAKDAVRIPAWDGSLPLEVCPYELRLSAPEALVECVACLFSHDVV